MSARSLHQLMRDRARRELRSSPMLWKEYMRRRWAVRLARAIAAWRVFVLMIGTIFAPTFLGWFMAMPLLVGVDEPSPTIVAIPQSLSLWPLVALSACLTGCCILIAGSLSEQVWRSHHLAVLVHFPISDRRFLRRQMTRTVGASFAGFIAVAIVLGAVANSRSVSVGSWPLIVMISLAEWMVVAATAILIAAHLAWRIHHEFISLGALMLVVFGAFLGSAARIANISPALACTIFALSPPGWIHAAFYFGAIQGVRAAWLFLLPAAVVIGVAVRWMAGTFSIREVSFFDGRASIAAIDGTARLAKPRFWDERRLAIASTRTSDQTTAQKAKPRALPVGEEFLRSLDWGRLGWMERLVADRLNERQRLLLECHDPGKPYWTRSWVASVVIACATAIVIYWPSAAQDDAKELLLAMLNAVALSVAVFSPQRDIWARAWHAYFPVGVRELARARCAQALLRLAATLPIVIALNATGALLSGRSVAGAVCVGVACCQVVIAWYLFGSCLAVSGATNDTANRWMLAAWIAAIFLLGTLSFAAIAPIGVARLASGTAALVLAWAMWRRYTWLLDNGAIDIVQ